ncbi:hypothetical protein [uncultured Chitinophaga sp.]|jgi:hypothetical protein|uniref:hypothetical protein n=1 Tax=uncultured Chitinophaga sp. TaxID=339340 RepID=UPI002630A3BE|nr:hypothetical protein [uncultured Chitinophaga sp.]
MPDTKTIDIHVKGRQYTLHLEQEAYNGRPAYYITDQNLSAICGCEMPDNLILFETEAGMECSPRVITMEGREVANEIWNAIKAPEKAEPQPNGPGLG